jgi:hypothetical protein
MKYIENESTTEEDKNSIITVGYSIVIEDEMCSKRRQTYSSFKKLTINLVEQGCNVVAHVLDISSVRTSLHISHHMFITCSTRSYYILRALSPLHLSCLPFLTLRCKWSVVIIHCIHSDLLIT